MHRGRFIDRLQTAIGGADAGGAEPIEAALQALTPQTTPFELIVLKDTVCRRIAHVGATRVCSNCAVLPTLLALIEANADLAQLRAAIGRARCAEAIAHSNDAVAVTVPDLAAGAAQNENTSQELSTDSDCAGR